MTEPTSTAMKAALKLSAALLFLLNLAAFGAVHYVSVNSTNPTPPYTNWETAAIVIQDAVDGASANDEIVVTNGVYAMGGRAVDDIMTNRVTIDKPLIVRSLNGPEVTVIQGYQVPGITNGEGAIRCGYLVDGAVLAGFTLMKGATVRGCCGDQLDCGGGVYCQSTFCMISNCIITGNSAYSFGGAGHGGAFKSCVISSNIASGCGGVLESELENCIIIGNSGYEQAGGGAACCNLNNCSLIGNYSGYLGGGIVEGTLNNCLLSGNSAQFGGGAIDAVLNNCTITHNSAFVEGGGLMNCLANNCIVYFNEAIADPNYASSDLGWLPGWLNFCCTTPLPPEGTGNFDSEPQLTSDWRLTAASPCRGAGSTDFASGLDIDGEAWLSPPSIGCDEYHSEAMTGDLQVSIETTYTNVAIGFPASFKANITGRTTTTLWDFGEGVLLSNRYSASQSWATPGLHAIILKAYNNTYPNGITSTAMVEVLLQPIHYVSLSSTNPIPPYYSWDTAATNIQDAVDAASVPGAMVLVSDGTYNTGGRVTYGLSNRVVVDKPLLLQSLSGPAFTFIVGTYFEPDITSCDDAVRCIRLVSGSVLSGFTLTNGSAWCDGDGFRDVSGGGAWCESLSTIITNCEIRGNTCRNLGGGVFLGTLRNCVLSGNRASNGGGAGYSRLQDCVIIGNVAENGGGGAACSILSDCTLLNNAAAGGGGAWKSSLDNCTLNGNLAGGGGGTYDSVLTNCTVSYNSADSGGGAFYGTLNNSLLQENSASSGGGAYSSALENCIIVSNTVSGDGGGVYDCTNANCVMAGNSAQNSGGGAVLSILNNCTLIGNSAGDGGGAYYGTLNNCTLTGNSAQNGGGAYAATMNNCTLTGNSAQNGGGTFSGTLNNCIVYYNTAPEGPNYLGPDFVYSCTTPLASGIGNIDTDPLFIETNGWVNLRLLSNSPCINAGNNAFAPSSRDLDGHLRIAGGTVDMGAYEYQSAASLLFDTWLQQFGFAADGTDDLADPDEDGMNNLQEWRCGTDPTNAGSVLRLVGAERSGANVVVEWRSVSGIYYFLERSTNLSGTPMFQGVATNLLGLPNTTSYQDTNAPGPVFYRVGVGN